MKNAYKYILLVSIVILALTNLTLSVEIEDNLANNLVYSINPEREIKLGKFKTNKKKIIFKKMYC